MRVGVKLGQYQLKLNLLYIHAHHTCFSCISLLIFRLYVTGDLDHLPEVAFYMVGPIEDVVAKAERLAEEQRQSEM
jgi:hypothetical protein